MNRINVPLSKNNKITLTSGLSISISALTKLNVNLKGLKDYQHVYCEHPCRCGASDLMCFYKVPRKNIIHVSANRRPISTLGTIPSHLELCNFMILSSFEPEKPKKKKAIFELLNIATLKDTIATLPEDYLVQYNAEEDVLEFFDPDDYDTITIPLRFYK
jgi:hypothetical protein